MSGKDKKPGEWGGKRGGSGRKPRYMLTEYQVGKMLRTAKKRAKDEGKSIDDILLDIIYNFHAVEVENKKGQIEIMLDVPTRDRLAAVKVFKDFTMTKHTEKDINVRDYRAPVRLPERRPDPAKLIPIDGGKSERKESQGTKEK